MLSMCRYGLACPKLHHLSKARSVFVSTNAANVAKFYAASSLEGHISSVWHPMLCMPPAQCSAHYVLHALQVSNLHVAVHQRPLLLKHGIPFLLLACWTILQVYSHQSGLCLQVPRRNHVMDQTPTRNDPHRKGALNAPVRLQAADVPCIDLKKP